MEYDVFISYAHLDNIAPQGQYGWVDNFHIALYQYLSGKLGLGRKAKIWRDRTGLRGNVLLNRALADNVSNSLIFIPILSPNYLASEYCAQELQTFINQNGALENGETHIFPVVKYPIDAPPPSLDESLLKFAFFNNDDFGDMSEELDPSLGGDFRNKFNQKVNDLARELAAFIKENLPPPILSPVVMEIPINSRQELTALSAELPIPSQSTIPKIYLAEPSPDLFDKYLEIKRDLEERREHGSLEFEFFPLPLEDSTQIPEKPDDAEEYKEIVRADTIESRLTIHLIGKNHNKGPFGSPQSYLELAMEAAAERDGEPNFNRLVWIPKNIFTEEEMLERSNGLHKAFVAKVRKTGVGGDGLMQDSFEKFKSRIINVLENKDEEEVDDETRWIYVLYDKSDLDSARTIENILTPRYPIFSSRDYLDPALSGNITKKEVIKVHNDYLAKCDAVLIYWHNSPLTWVRQNVWELPKIKSKRKKRTFRAQAVFCDGEDMRAKEAFRSPPPPNLMKIEGLSNLSKFLDKLQGAK